MDAAKNNQTRQTDARAAAQYNPGTMDIFDIMRIIDAIQEKPKKQEIMANTAAFASGMVTAYRMQAS